MDAEIRIEDAERAFRSWRRGRRTSGGKSIPDELWAQAVSVARIYGVTKTAERLRLNGTRLKERYDVKARGRGFVELAASELPHAGEFVVELEDATGVRLRVVLRGVSIATATATAKELWGATR